jgi:hypothetical protein
MLVWVKALGIAYVIRTGLFVFSRFPGAPLKQAK